MEKQQEACQMLIIRKTVEENGIRFADIQITYPRLLQKETAATEEKQTKKNAGKRVRRVSERKECTETLNAHFSSVAGNFYKYCTEQLAENERSRYGQMTEPNKRFLYRGIKAGMFLSLIHISMMQKFLMRSCFDICYPYLFLKNRFCLRGCVIGTEYK